VFHRVEVKNKIEVDEVAQIDYAAKNLKISVTRVLQPN
jgi:hypothetical protein